MKYLYIVNPSNLVDFMIESLKDNPDTVTVGMHMPARQQTY